MSLWKKLGLGLVAAFVLLIVALIVAIVVPGGWKISIFIVGVPAAVVWVVIQIMGESHSSSRRDDPPPPPPARRRRPGDEHGEPWR
ncbi:hypothetical protein [Nonomuraea endophytica]|uniref:Uncharacterized protein n=1 Tax=Nonomuraea endophytica TaxID=714136 RepID=A0A7W8AGI7_9ACTN|nr:hypothetical protein [Nonomuraea endophytica]MBB5084711.1 hypothetical protein [Nonomuraea endophytica]